MRTHIRAPRTLASGLLAGSAVLLWAMPVLAADQTVVMTGSTFSPATVTVRAGDTVTWVNQDPLDHDATANDGSWATPTFGEGGSGAMTFQTVGSFPYYCTIHPEMTGTVVVQAAPATSAPTGGPTAPPTDTGGAPDPASEDVGRMLIPWSSLLIAAGGASITWLAIRRRSVVASD
jgi:plastocyanin